MAAKEGAPPPLLADGLPAAEPAQLTKPIKAVEDKYALLPAFLKVRGLVKQHIDSFNHFIDKEMRNIIRAKGNERVTCDTDPTFYLRYTNIYVGTPELLDENGQAERGFSPQMCRLRDLTYSAPVSVDVEYTKGKDLVVAKSRDGRTGAVPIGRMPVMLRSKRCVLTGKDEEQLARLGECPLDPGGYFVVKGTEKVVLIQEQLSKNRILVDLDPRGAPVVSATSSTTERKSKTNLALRRGVLCLHHNAFVEQVNLAIVLRGMGVESDQEMHALIGQEGAVEAALAPTLRDARAQGVTTQHAALAWLGRKVKNHRGGPFVRRQRPPVDEARDILANVILSHVPTRHYDFQQKVLYLAVMVRRLLAAAADPRLVDDRDYTGNKRLELAGSLLALLFEDLFKRLNADLKKKVDAHLSRSGRGLRDFDPTKFVAGDTLTQGLEQAISSGNWTIKRFRMERKGVTQVLSRLSFIAALGMMTRITSQFEKTRKVSGPRALQASQWGMLCPADTPEGESCGLVKNLALLTHVTTEEDPRPLTRLVHALGTLPASLAMGRELHAKGTAAVFLNGLLLGLHRRPAQLARCIRRLRRAGRISEFVSVSLQQQTVQLACDGGRVCRPLIICDQGVPRVTAEHTAKLAAGEWGFGDLTARGLVEYLDCNEESAALVALYEADCQPGTTHLEVEPFTVLGIVAGLVPFPHHNQSPRNTYQCAMGKQAMGNVAYNQLDRIDTLLYLLSYPQRPLVTTKTIELVGYDRLGAGQNAIVAVMSYSGYDIEDAIVMNRASLDRGFGRCVVMRKYATTLKRHANRARDSIFPPPAPGPGAEPGRPFHGGGERLRLLGPDGIVDPGQRAHPGDILFNKQTPIAVKKTTTTSKGEVTEEKISWKATPLAWKGPPGEQAMVDKVLLTSNEEGHDVFKARPQPPSLRPFFEHRLQCATLRQALMRQTRRPEVGDKLSSRHGQKGVVGAVVAQADLPFSEAGICPDLIMNPHGFPSRMTVGKMLELMGAKAAVCSGRLHYGTAFGERSGHADTIEAMSQTLVEHGFSYSGKDALTCGITGNPLECLIFMGPVYYQKLKHMVVDKMHARARGPRVVLTRQPTEGRSRDGGLRLGEMERDCLIAYGASALLLERLCISSDQFKVHVCTHCGLLGYQDQGLGCAVCPATKSPDHMATLMLPYACKLLFQELQAMNIAPRLELSAAS